MNGNCDGGPPSNVLLPSWCRNSDKTHLSRFYLERKHFRKFVFPYMCIANPADNPRMSSAAFHVSKTLTAALAAHTRTHACGQVVARSQLLRHGTCSEWLDVTPRANSFRLHIPNVMRLAESPEFSRRRASFFPRLLPRAAGFAPPPASPLPPASVKN